MEWQTGAVVNTPLKERLVQGIVSRTNGMVRDLRVDVENDRVIIAGRATTYYAKQLATHAVFELLHDETVPVSNEIDVF